jgi:hypothetical protein
MRIRVDIDGRSLTLDWPGFGGDDEAHEVVLHGRPAQLPAHGPWGWSGGRLSVEGLVLERRGSRTSGRFSTSQSDPHWPVRFAVQPLALEAGALMLHAATVDLSNGLHLFAAPSGTGKSTLAKRLGTSGFRVRSDEVAMVRGGLFAGFPFQPMSDGSTGTAPLAAIHLLGRGEPSSRRLGPGEATAQLLALAWMSEPGEMPMRRALDAASRIVAAVPAFETRLPNDERATTHLIAFASGASR